MIPTNPSPELKAKLAAAKAGRPLPRSTQPVTDTFPNAPKGS